MKLFYLGTPADTYGWGVANTNLIRELSKLCEVVVDTTSQCVDCPAFIPILDSNLTPCRNVVAPRKIGYCFTEWPLGDEAKRNSRQYDVIFAGSTWNAQRLLEKGIKSEVLHQGVDFDRFKVQPWTPFETVGRNPKFVVFSGGKFEFRKGQDYVVAAMRHFMKVHPDVVLLTAWHNIWPASRATMSNSWLVDDINNPVAELPKERVIALPQLRNEQMPEIYAQAHLGIFPNRCEAGTNLVMCEFMACGRPVIATSATGHADVFFDLRWNPAGHPEVVIGSNEKARRGYYPLENCTFDSAGWCNPNVSDIIAHLEHAYQHKEQLQQRGLVCRQLVERFTWRACAEKIFRAAFPKAAGHGIQSPALASQ